MENILDVTKDNKKRCRYCENAPKKGKVFYEVTSSFRDNLSKRIVCKQCFLREYAAKVIPEYLTKKAKRDIIAQLV
jgi:hypothetical protein